MTLGLSSVRQFFSFFAVVVVAFGTADTANIIFGQQAFESNIINTIAQSIAAIGV